MKNILYTIILSFLFSFSVFADFEAGMDAYEIGHYKTAYKEFRSAAEQGDPAAQFQLGQMYSGGEGVTRDYQEEVKWYQIGDCIKKNYGRGYKYVQEFLVDNTEFPKVVRKLKLISPKILAKAKRIGHECAKKNYEDHG